VYLRGIDNIEIVHAIHERRRLDGDLVRAVADNSGPVLPRAAAGGAWQITPALYAKRQIRQLFDTRAE
jgi:hypothetical protein